MTVTDQHKIIDNKISANQAPYDLDRLAAKISPYSSGDFRKYEYLTGEDLGYKPSVVEQAKFEYFQLGKICNKELPEEDKKEGLFKRLETIKGKNEELLKEIKKQKSQIVRPLRLKILCFMTQITILGNTDCLNFLKHRQLNLNLITLCHFTTILLV